jgi:hypothetical protein
MPIIYPDLLLDYKVATHPLKKPPNVLRFDADTDGRKKGRSGFNS